MTEMIDRAVAALKRLPIRDDVQRGSELDELRLREAVRAVIQAMRDPTVHMLNAGWQTDGWPRQYRAAIDAALNEKSPTAS